MYKFFYVGRGMNTIVTLAYFKTTSNKHIRHTPVTYLSAAFDKSCNTDISVQL